MARGERPDRTNSSRCEPATACRANVHRRGPWRQEQERSSNPCRRWSARLPSSPAARRGERTGGARTKRQWLIVLAQRTRLSQSDLLSAAHLHGGVWRLGKLDGGARARRACGRCAIGARSTPEPDTSTGTARRCTHVAPEPPGPPSTFSHPSTEAAVLDVMSGGPLSTKKKISPAQAKRRGVRGEPPAQKACVWRRHTYRIWVFSRLAPLLTCLTTEQSPGVTLPPPLKHIMVHQPLYSR